MTLAPCLPVGPKGPSAEAWGWPDLMPSNIHVTNQLPLFCLSLHQATFWEFGQEACLHAPQMQAQGPKCLVPWVAPVRIIN